MILLPELSAESRHRQVDTVRGLPVFQLVDLKWPSQMLVTTVDRTSIEIQLGSESLWLQRVRTYREHSLSGSTLVKIAQKFSLVTDL